MIKRSSIVATSFAAAALAIAGAAQAGTLINTGFESPDYTLGNLVGQNGWDAVSLFDDHTVTARVQSSVVKTGTQAVSLTGTGEGSASFAYNMTPYIPATDKIVTIAFDMNWGESGFSRSFVYGLQAYDTDLNLAGSVGVTQLFGFYNAAIFDEEGTPVPIPGATILPGEWHHFKLVLDYESQTYHASVDGFLSATIPFQTEGLTNYGEADLYRDAGLGNANDTGYFDNLSITTGSIVPEPATLGLLGGLGVTLLRRRA